MPPQSSPQSDNTAMRGFLFALSAYLLWGFLPFYMKAVAHIPAPEVVAHRIVWSVPIAGAVLLLLGRTADVKAAFRSPRTLLMAALTASLITVNWGIYVWAIAADRAVETALGYYINPLVIVAMGAVLLGEKLSRLQIAAVALAAVAVLALTFDGGGLPWVSLALAISFALYAFLRKTLPVGPSQGFFLEVLILSVPRSVLHFLASDEGRRPFLTVRALEHCAADRLRSGHGRAAHAIRVRRQAAALFDHRHHAIHCTDNDFHHRDLRFS